jgi:hypothetical protein
MATVALVTPAGMTSVCSAPVYVNKCEVCCALHVDCAMARLDAPAKLKPSAAITQVERCIDAPIVVDP